MVYQTCFDHMNQKFKKIFPQCLASSFFVMSGLSLALADELILLKCSTLANGYKVNCNIGETRCEEKEQIRNLPTFFNVKLTTKENDNGKKIWISIHNPEWGVSNRGLQEGLIMSFPSQLYDEKVVEKGILSSEVKFSNQHYMKFNLNRFSGWLRFTNILEEKEYKGKYKIHYSGQCTKIESLF